ncbi:hypothetical protein IWX47DRAFT_267618 [Phyllosticta citricarpa]
MLTLLLTLLLLLLLLHMARISLFPFFSIPSLWTAVVVVVAWVSSFFLSSRVEDRVVYRCCSTQSRPPTNQPIMDFFGCGTMAPPHPPHHASIHPSIHPCLLCLVLLLLLLACRRLFEDHPYHHYYYHPSSRYQFPDCPPPPYPIQPHFLTHSFCRSGGKEW